MALERMSVRSRSFPSIGSCFFLVHLLWWGSPPQDANASIEAFRWRAWIDHDSGVAGSMETSTLSGMPTTHHSVATRLLSSYPQWLAKGSVTFGLLQSTSIERNGKICTDVSLRWLGTSVLRFGNAHPTRNRKEGDSIVVQIPMIGGIMVGGKDEDNVTDKDNTVGVLQSRRKQDYGALSFALKRHGTTIGSSNKMTMETRIVGNYQPSLVGGPSSFSPIRRTRAAFYRCTQSVVHAYVMRRFHRYCSEELLRRQPSNGAELRNS